MFEKRPWIFKGLQWLPLPSSPTLAFYFAFINVIRGEESGTREQVTPA